ncbi:hypothetical protein [Saccharopolyspora thermophila]|nr:hypothetical protein [Saccharopolyspora subtropica]
MHTVTVPLLLAAGMLGGTGVAAAVIDPIDAATCLAETPSELTSALDPTALPSPTELPGVNCLAP